MEKRHVCGWKEINVEEDASIEEVTIPAEGSTEEKTAGPLKINAPETAEPQALPTLEEPLEARRDTLPTPSEPQSLEKKNNTATLAVRHLLNKLNLDIVNIKGTGKGGRVKEEDIDRHVSSTATTSSEDEPTAMFKTLTRSSTIPHFLYTHTVEFTTLSRMKKTHNSSSSNHETLDTKPSKLTALLFIMKAPSRAFIQFPTLNAHLDNESGPNKPQLLIKGAHNFGIAVDTPQGLLVPVVNSVQNHSITFLAGVISRLGNLAKAGKLALGDFKYATIIVSNIGSIGGGVVAFVIAAPMVGILGVGRKREVPVFKENEQGARKLVEREEVVLSWSADHRILDGATVARCAETVRKLLEDIDVLSIVLR
ncbi:uncharacterized protein PAC_02354 [Phialocephala subalpina]|uniref:Peripheral subunit-binding (PSBD) domain-containing protein n=1 Tax=Phialocephala subalpina TaxID=576137 RepID=A0A1L7WIA3_9HELO|nr:uncharacterized protein PAC_02354 [Phialocephala subalpina]